MAKELDLPDGELLKRMLAGDESALSTLYRRRQAGIYRFALQMGNSPALAEDVTQEVFMLLMREGAMFDETRGSLKSFLLGIARNLVRQKLSREKFYVPMGDETNGEIILNGHQTVMRLLDEVIRDETIESVRQAVLSLPTPYREVAVLCDLQEMSYAEAAMVLNCAIGTVRSRLHRARALLLEKLQPAREEDKGKAAVRSARCFA
jgi:RNA polymerase sigma-70 factor (ECF subfamily)